MVNFFKSIFSGKEENPEAEKNRNEEKNFDILKYDGMRAQRMCGKLPYAIKCFTEALNIREDAETRTHLAAAYISAGKPEEALGQMDRLVELQPDNIEARLMRIQILFLLDRDADVPADCQHILSIDSENYQAYFQMAKAKKATGDLFGAIADLTKCVAIKDDFSGAYQLRAELLLAMRQGAEAENKLQEAEDFLTESLETLPDAAALYAERGRIRNLRGDKKGAFDDVKKSIELNPQGEMAQLCNGQHSNFDNLYKGGIF